MLAFLFFVLLFSDEKLGRSNRSCGREVKRRRRRRAAKKKMAKRKTSIQLRNPGELDFSFE